MGTALELLRGERTAFDVEPKQDGSDRLLLRRAGATCLAQLVKICIGLLRWTVCRTPGRAVGGRLDLMARCDLLHPAPAVGDETD